MNRKKHFKYVAAWRLRRATRAAEIRDYKFHERIRKHDDKLKEIEAVARIKAAGRFTYWRKYWQKRLNEKERLIAKLEAAKPLTRDEARHIGTRLGMARVSVDAIRQKLYWMMTHV